MPVSNPILNIPEMQENHDEHYYQTRAHDEQAAFVDSKKAVMRSPRSHANRGKRSIDDDVRNSSSETEIKFANNCSDEDESKQ